MTARVVIGANFGDEGKGAMTDYLCSQGAGTVVRFNGGAQAGHTVVTPEGERHVFRHFGSGSFCDVPTFLSQFFVCNPILFLYERDQLIKLGFHPVVYAHPDCLVTTFADMAINQMKELGRGDKRHGSCGVGFHETIVRSRVPELKVTMSDLWNKAPDLERKLEEICTKYSHFRIKQDIPDHQALCSEFLKACEQFSEEVQPLGIAQCSDPVFEGAQGLLLDQDNRAYFPHVTHSKTGMNNVRVLCEQAGISDIEVYYVSRTYLTRHGYGPLPGEDDALSYADDTNHKTEFQGKLRFAPLDNGLLSRCKLDCRSDDFKVVLTHCDQEPAPSNLDADLYFSGPTRNDVAWSRPDSIVEAETAEA